MSRREEMANVAKERPGLSPCEKVSQITLLGDEKTLLFDTRRLALMRWALVYPEISIDWITTPDGDIPPSAWEGAPIWEVHAKASPAILTLGGRPRKSQELCETVHPFPG